MAVSTLYDIITFQEEPYQILEFEEYAPMDIDTLKRFPLSFDGSYSSFSVVPVSKDSITLHDFYPLTGQIGVHELPIDLEEQPDMTIIGGVLTFSTYSSLIRNGDTQFVLLYMVDFMRVSFMQFYYFDSWVYEF